MPATPSRLPALLQQFRGAPVLVVGDLVADHYVYGETDRVSREAPVLVVRYESSDVKLGGAANVAANLRSLDGEVIALGVVSDDEMGQAVASRCAESGIRLVASTAPKLRTETKMRVLAGGLNTRRQQMLRVDRGNALPLPREVREQLATRLRSLAKEVRLVVASDYGAGVVDDEVRTTLRELAQEGVPVCVDSRYALRTFAGVTVCKPNEPELEALSGREIHSEEDLLEAGRVALRLLPGSSLLVTRGHRGMALFEAGGKVHLIPAHGDREAVDVTGAGDTVLATLALSLAAGASLLEAAQLANVAGALVVEKPGTATLVRDELQSELPASE